MDPQARWRRARGPLSNLRRGMIVAATLIASVTGLFVGLETSSAGAAQSVPATGPRGHPGAGGQGSNARSGPAAGGSSGRVGNVAKSSFTLTTSAGQEVTVDEGGFDQIRERDERDFEERRHRRRTRPRSGNREFDKYQSNRGPRANDWRKFQHIDCGNGGSFSERCAGNVTAGRPDPCELQSGLGDHRQRNGGQQGNGSRADGLSGRRMSTAS